MGRPKIKRITISCRVCGKSFRERASKERVYCSRKCMGVDNAVKYKKGRIKISCESCGKKFEVYPARADAARFCGRACHNKTISRETAEQRGNTLRGRGTGKKGAYRPDTYIKKGGRHLHRTIAEEKIGRPLRPGETVHHIDGNRRNNDPKNIVVLASQAEHARIHAKIRRSKKGKRKRSQ